MKYLKRILRMIFIPAMLSLLTLSAFGAEDLNVYPAETTTDPGEAVACYALAADDPAPLSLTPSVQRVSVSNHAISDEGISMIIGFEGFSAEPFWDVSRYSIGYGNSYDSAKKLFGEDCAPITKEQAYELLKSEAVATENYLNRFLAAHNIALNQNQFDALMSFTYNVGIGWITYKNSEGGWCLLRTMLEDDPATWTEERAQTAFGSWVSANGQILPGLVKRRAAEAKLFLTSYVPPTDSGAGEGSEAGSEEGSGNPPEDAPVVTPPISFTDVKEDSWYYSTVMMACQLGLMQGMGDGCFAPDDSLTRAQLVQLLVNYGNVTDLDSNAETGFSDVPPGKWYTGAIAWAVEKGYVNGMGDGTFLPDEPVTREQMCTILARYLKSQGCIASGTGPVFSDEGDISSYAKESVAFCAALGLIQGMDDGTFAPLEETTRAQAATVLLRMVDLG